VMIYGLGIQSGMEFPNIRSWRRLARHEANVNAIAGREPRSDG
jgi:hypothetical protein